MPYQVGILTSPKPDDEWLGDEHLAREVALAWSHRDANLPVCVWDVNNEPIVMYLAGRAWQPQY